MSAVMPDIGRATVADKARVAVAAAHRNVTVDVAKGLGILLVVLGHNVAFRLGMHSAYEAIYLFHMPLFFFLSGVTFKLSEPGDAFRKRFRSLLVPYFAMGALAVGFDLLMSNSLKAVSEFQGVLYGTGHTLRFTPLWFLPCLFMVSMSATLLLSLHQRWLARAASAQENTRFLIGVAVISAVVGTAVVTSGRFGRPPFEDVLGRPLGLPWSLDLLPLVLAFFVLGVLLASARFLRNCPQPWVVIVAGVGILLPLVANGVSLDLNYRRMTHPLGVAAGIAAGVALVIALSTLIARHGLLARLFSYLGSASLVVLMFHGAVQRRLMDQLAPWVSNEIALAALGATLTVAAICAVDLVVLRRIPALGWVCYPRRAAARAA